MKINFLEKHGSVARTRDPALRGFRFQDLLGEFLAACKFEVHLNPRAANPRQSDLFATYDEMQLLIEAKWTSRKLDTSDIDDLRARLERTPPQLVGCIISMSQYTRPAIQAVAADRKREIVLFRPDEMRECFSGREDFISLLKIKRKEIVVDGRVWFLGQVSRRTPAPKINFPEASCCLTSVGSTSFQPGNESPSDVVFTHRMPDVCWNMVGGFGVGLHLNLKIDRLSELKDFLELVHRQLGLTSDGTFSIHQTSASWHGFGVSNLLAEASRWNERYESLQLERIHHSEDLHYFDTCRSGFLLLTARQLVDGAALDKDCRLHACELQIRLAGVPLDIRPFSSVCEAAGDHDPYFAPLSERELDEVRVGERIYLEPVESILMSGGYDEELVCGLVTKNPFMNSKLIPTGRLKYSPLQFLGSTDRLICSLSDWHGKNDVADKYYIRTLSGMNISGVMVFSVSCTWEKIERCQRSRKRLTKREQLRRTKLLLQQYGAKI